MKRGATFVEMLCVMLILAFVTVGTLQLYRVGDSQQRSGRFYSDAQTTAREALRRILRTVRHASAITVGSTVANFAGAPNSSTSQIIVEVPQPYPGTGSDSIRFYVSSGTLYAQRQDDTGPGVAIASGVQALTFQYYLTTVQSSGTATTNVDGAPATANEVGVSLTIRSGTVETTQTAYVSCRNKNLGF